VNQTTEPIRLLLDVVRNTGDFLGDTASGVLNALAVARPAPEHLGTSSPRT
jgi:hypothetical protein